MAGILRKAKNTVGQNLPDSVRRRLPGLALLGRSLAKNDTKLKQRAIDTLKGKRMALSKNQMTQKNRDTFTEKRFLSFREFLREDKETLIRKEAT